MKNPFKGLFTKKGTKNTALAKRQDGALATPEALLQKRPGRSDKAAPKSPPDGYYVKLSSVSRFWRYVVTFTLLIFAVGMTFLFREEITAENFGLLLRNVSFSFPGENVEFTTVRYDADLQMDFEAYKEYFAVATTGSLRLYDHRGHIALDEKLEMKAPALDAGEKYVMVYDKEGHEYIVCNSISLLFTGKEQNPIHCADLCDEGSFLLLTMSSGYRSLIKVYNKGFNLQREIPVDRYPLSAKLSPDGNTMLFLSYTTNEQGVLEGYVNLYDLGEKTRLIVEDRYESMPLYGCLTNDGAAVVFEDCVRFYDRSGKQIAVQSFGGKAPIRCADDGALLALLFEEDSVAGRYTLKTFHTDRGDMILEKSYKGRVRALFVCAGTAFLAEDEKTVGVSFDGKSGTVKCKRPLEILCSENGTVFACHDNKAENIGKTQSLQEQQSSSDF
jgi:hypothetical protein